MCRNFLTSFKFTFFQELTGELPPETPFQPGEPQPQIRRRVGTSFTISDKIICKAKNKDVCYTIIFNSYFLFMFFSNGKF